MYLFISRLERAFESDCRSPSAFDDTVNDILENSTDLNFHCNEHKTDIISSIIVYYVTMRMRQYSCMHNRDQ